MRKTYFGIALIVFFGTLVKTVSCQTSLRDISERYSQEQILLKNLVKSVRHNVRIRSEINMPYYCAFIFSLPGSKPMEMINMLRLMQETQVIINTWPNSKANYTVANRRNWSECENIIVFASMTDVHRIIDKVNVTCTDARIGLFVAIYDILESDDEAKGAEKSIVDFAWERIRPHAIVLISDGSQVLTQSERHMPYIRYEPKAPRIMLYWENNTFIGNLLFKRFGYNKCVIRVSTGNSCGLLMRLVKSNGKETMVGVEGQILVTIAQKQNYTLEVINAIPLKLNAVVIPNATFVKKKLESGEADIAAGSLWISYWEGMKYAVSYSAYYVVLMIPLPNYTPSASIFQTLSQPVWICIGVSWIVGRVLIRMSRRSISSLMVLGLVLGISVTSGSCGFVEKWQMILWLVYGYLITQNYIASLASVLNNLWTHKVETIEELAISDIRVAGYTPQSQSFRIDDKYERIVETYINVQETEHTKVMDNPDKSLLGVGQTRVLVDILLLNRHSWLSRYYQSNERISNLPLGIPVMSHSRISLNKIDQTIVSLIENGSIPRWTEIDMLPLGTAPISPDIEAPSPTQSLDEVAGIFLILPTGLFAEHYRFYLRDVRKETIEE